MRTTHSANFWFWGGLGALALALASAWMLYGALQPFFIALGLAYAFRPVVDWMVDRGLRRSWAVGILMLGLGLVAGLALAFLLPLFYEEGRNFLVGFPAHVSVALSRVAEFGNRHGFDFPVGKELMDSLQQQVNRMALGDLAPGAGAIRRVFSGVGSVADFTLNVMVVPLFFFFLLRDLPKIKRFSLGLIPRRHQEIVVLELRKVDHVFSAYIRGQLTVSLILAAAFATALSVIGVKFGLVIGILSGFLNIVPYVGQAIGMFLALGMAALDFQGWARFLAIPALFGIVNFIEGNFITPNIVGGAVGLSPIQAILALMIGASLGGVVGMAVAIPLAGSAKVLFVDLLQAYRESEYYKAVPKKKGKR